MADQIAAQEALDWLEGFLLNEADVFPTHEALEKIDTIRAALTPLPPPPTESK